MLSLLWVEEGIIIKLFSIAIKKHVNQWEPFVW